MTFRGVSIAIPDVLVDTGAASTVLNADIAAEANVLLQHSDRAAEHSNGLAVHRKRLGACSFILP